MDTYGLSMGTYGLSMYLMWPIYDKSEGRIDIPMGNALAGSPDVEADILECIKFPDIFSIVGQTHAMSVSWRHKYLVGDWKWFFFNPRFFWIRVTLAGSQDPINFTSQLLSKFKEISDVHQYLFELKQCCKNNWIQSMDRLNRPLWCQHEVL